MTGRCTVPPPPLWSDPSAPPFRAASSREGAFFVRGAALFPPPGPAAPLPTRVLFIAGVGAHYFVLVSRGHASDAEASGPPETSRRAGPSRRRRKWHFPCERSRQRRRPATRPARPEPSRRPGAGCATSARRVRWRRASLRPRLPTRGRSRGAPGLVRPRPRVDPCARALVGCSGPSPVRRVASTARRRHEVRLQGGAPFREAPLRGGEDPQEVPRPSPGHRGEGPQGAHRRPGQEEVPGPLGPHSGAVLLPDPEKDPPAGRGRPLFLRQQRHPSHQRHYGAALPGTSRGGFFPLHSLQR